MYSYAVMTNITLHLCEAHTSILLSTEADLNASQNKPIRVAKKNSFLFWNEKDQKTHKNLTIKK